MYYITKKMRVNHRSSGKTTRKGYDKNTPPSQASGLWRCKRTPGPFGAPLKYHRGKHMDLMI